MKLILRFVVFKPRGWPLDKKHMKFRNLWILEKISLKISRFEKHHYPHK